MVGERIRQALLAAGLTFPQVAKRTGLTEGYLNQLEMGHKKNPSLKTLSLVASAVGVTVPWLVAECEPAKAPAPRRPPARKARAAGDR